jgi:hypothetical protein
LIKEQTELEKQRMLIAQQQQEQNEMALENQRVIDNINAAQSQDTGNSDNSGSGSSSDNSEKSDNDDKNIFADKNLGSDSHFVIMSQDDNNDDGPIGLFQVVSDETALDTNILPKTIHPIKSFDTAQEAISWISQYDDRNN